MKNLRYIILAVLLFPLRGVGGFCQSKLTFKECVEIAIKNNLTYRESQINSAGAKADNQLAKSQKLPQINAYFGQSTNVGRSINRADNSYTDALYNANALGLQFNVPIFNGFQLQYRIQQTGLIEESLQKNSEAARNRLIINLLTAYVQTLATQELAEVARQQVESSKLQVERMNKQVAAGTVGQSALNDLKSLFANDNFAYTTSKNNNIMARLLLFQLMNQTPNRTTIFEPLIDENIAVNNVSVSEIYEKAITIFPEIKSAELRVKSFESLVKYTKANTLPSLGLSGGYGTFYASSDKTLAYFDQFNGNRSGSLSFSLNIPILGKMQNQYRVSSANVQRIFAENQLNTAKLTLIQAVEQANQGFLAASERFTVATEQVQATEQSVATAESRINAGTAGFVEYSLAKTNYARALANLVQAKYELILQKKAINYYQTGEFRVE
jgi:outer membrane protein